MLKVRLIPTIVLKGDLLVQSIQFNRFLPIGKIDAAIEFFNNWDVDEIVIIDIDATKEGRGPFLKSIERAAKNCMVPLTIGGGISRVDQVKDLLNVGADKVCINTSAIENIEFVSAIAEIYGSQFVTVSVDFKKLNNDFYACSRNGKVHTEIKAIDHIRKVVAAGAGEILVHSVDRDGTKLGYDIPFLKTVREAVNVPIVTSGGAGRFSHFVEAVQMANVNGVAAGNLFQFTELSTVAAKAFMKKHDLSIRIDSDVTYSGYRFDIFERPI